MENTEPIRCRMAACREALDDGKEWSFYLINDNDVALDLAVLYAVSTEWGDVGNSEATDVRVMGLAPGAHALMWRDDGSRAEFRVELSLHVQVLDREVLMQFEFPKLYRLRNPQLVDGLGKPGWQIAAEGQRAGKGSSNH